MCTHTRRKYAAPRSTELTIPSAIVAPLPAPNPPASCQRPRASRMYSSPCGPLAEIPYSLIAKDSTRTVF